MAEHNEQPKDKDESLSSAPQQAEQEDLNRKPMKAVCVEEGITVGDKTYFAGDPEAGSMVQVPVRDAKALEEALALRAALREAHPENPDIAPMTPNAEKPVGSGSMNRSGTRATSADVNKDA